jgi:signal transduction histidine kinase
VEIVREAAAAVRGTTGHRLRVDAAADELRGLWGGRRLERAVTNLLSNATKYSPPGTEVAVTIAREDDVRGAWAVVSVRDRGIGIPAADLPHVFDRFRRGGNVGRVPGAGVGLAGVRQIAEQHGGSVAVESREGAGSTFTLRLPLADRPAHEPAAAVRLLARQIVPGAKAAGI